MMNFLIIKLCKINCKLYKNNNNKKSYKNITDEFNEMGNFTLNAKDDKK